MEKRIKQKNYRRCISCGLYAPKEQFWRVVRNYPDGHITLDKGMGRSAYICPRQDCLEIAQKKKRLAKALKIPIPPEIFQQLWQRLQQDPTKGYN
ncbi:MAG: YlxR family protein [Geminocystis sp.]|nr:YlxR family protein [Geminocystis sp.]HIK38715.1 YlxR family protein [Geminocystis sp. M7585_C2015_104]MCS7148866.1 YlxR family protein [Geminocystis sp.]MCX8078843.1 YlxR family protein [Geminocystis sp.]MDW8115950.1 YlxR family protein [Geminocystis sp.]